LKLLDNLEDLMDVQKVYSNADFPDEVLEKYRSDG
jgi:transcriptional/translational regulatory protein YebC/TACO1